MQAGKNVDLTANRDITLLSAQNTSLLNAENKFDPWSNGLKEKYNLNMPSVTGQASQKSLLPSVISNTAGALSTEGANKLLNDTTEKINKKGVVK